MGTAADPYTSITVTKDSITPSSYLVSDALAGIVLDSQNPGDMDVYIGSGSTISVKNSGSGSAKVGHAVGIINTTAHTLNINAAGPVVLTTQVVSDGSTSYEAVGVNNYSYATTKINQPLQITVTSDNNDGSPVRSVVTGLYNGGTWSGGDLTISATARNSGAGYTEAMGIYDRGQGTFGTLHLTVHAENTGTVGDLLTMGFYCDMNNSVVTQDIDVNASGVNASTNNAFTTNVYGIYASSANIKLQGDVNVTATMEKSSASPYGFAGAVDAEVAASLYLNTADGVTGLGNRVQLTGDVIALSKSVNNIVLAGQDSYLQGNIRDYVVYNFPIPVGTNNVTVTEGAVWQPVYDNRNNGFTKVADQATWGLDYQVTANSTKSLTLSNGGIVDLTWDNAANGKRSGVFRTLSIDTLKGDGGVFRINSDLAGSKADQIVLGQGTTTTATNVAVKYDPYLDTAGLKKGNGLSGNAVVFSGDGVGSLASVTGVQDSYNLYTYTPTFAKNADGTWSLTGLNIDKPLPTGPASGHVKSSGHDRLGLNSLFQFETNSLSRRLGELRDAATNETAAATKNGNGKNSGATANASGKTANATSGGDTTSGIWARYHDGKLEQGDASLKANLFQAGYDKRSDGKTEKTYRGAALSYAKGNGTYELGTGHVKETTLSLYQTGIKNDGRYYDVVLKAGKYMNDYDVTNTANPSSADYSTWAYSISGEVGKRFDLGKGLYVEPQAEMILGRLNGADYTTSTDMNVNVDAQNKAITRLGLAFGKSYSRGSLYGKFSYYHDFGSGINLNAAANGASAGYSEDLAKNWTELTIGGSAKLGKNANAYAEVSKYMGQLTSNVRYNIGARWSF